MDEDMGLDYYLEEMYEDRYMDGLDNDPEPFYDEGDDEFYEEFYAPDDLDDPA